MPEPLNANCIANLRLAAPSRLVSRMVCRMVSSDPCIRVLIRVVVGWLIVLGTLGDVQIAVDAMMSASNPHHFLGINSHGLAAICSTNVASNGLNVVC